MKATIVINCETKSELMTHLSVIRDQLNRRLKGVKGYDVISERIKIEDDSTYGDHECVIEPDEDGKTLGEMLEDQFKF